MHLAMVTAFPALHLFFLPSPRVFFFVQLFVYSFISWLVVPTDERLSWSPCTGLGGRWGGRNDSGWLCFGGWSWVLFWHRFLFPSFRRGISSDCVHLLGHSKTHGNLDMLGKTSCKNILQIWTSVCVLGCVAVSSFSLDSFFFFSSNLPSPNLSVSLSTNSSVSASSLSLPAVVPQWEAGAHREWVWLMLPDPVPPGFLLTWRTHTWCLASVLYQLISYPPYFILSSDCLPTALSYFLFKLLLSMYREIRAR